MDDLVVEEEEIPLAPLADPHPLEGRYEFIMIADYEDGKRPFPDTFNTGWEGIFTIDSKGKIVGDGSFHFNAEVYFMVEFPEPCGYKWDGDGVLMFDIGGTVLPDSLGIPIKLYIPTLFEGIKMNGPDQICPSNIDKIINEPRYKIFGETRRGSMLGAIITPINFGSSVIPQAGVPFELTFKDDLLGEVKFNITVTYLGL